MGLRPRIVRDRGDSLPHHLSEEQTRHLLGYDGQPSVPGGNGDDPWEAVEPRKPLTPPLVDAVRERPGTSAVVAGVIIAIVILIAGGGDRPAVKRQAAPDTTRSPVAKAEPEKREQATRRHRREKPPARTVASAAPALAPDVSASQKRRPCRARGAGVKAAQATTTPTTPTTTTTTTTPEPPPTGGRQTTSPDSSATGGETTPTTTTEQPGAKSESPSTGKNTRKRSPSRRHSSRAPCGQK